MGLKLDPTYPMPPGILFPGLRYLLLISLHKNFSSAKALAHSILRRLAMEVILEEGCTSWLDNLCDLDINMWFALLARPSYISFTHLANGNNMLGQIESAPNGYHNHNL